MEENKLIFLEQPPRLTNTKVKIDSWAAEVGAHDTFVITRVMLQDLINQRSGRSNFFGYEKPKLGTLEELTDVFLPVWLYYVSLSERPRVRPLVGNFNGGFQTYREADEMCNAVWRQRGKYRTHIVKPRSTLVLPCIFHSPEASFR